MKCMWDLYGKRLKGGKYLTIETFCFPPIVQQVAFGCLQGGSLHSHSGPARNMLKNLHIAQCLKCRMVGILTAQTNVAHQQISSCTQWLESYTVSPFSGCPAFLYVFLRRTQGTTESGSKDQDLQYSVLNHIKGICNIPSAEKISNPWFCGGLQRCAVELQACRSAVDPIKHWLEAGIAKRGFAICCMEEEESRGVKDSFLTWLKSRRQSPTAFISQDGRCWLGLLWNAVTGEGAKHPLKM